MVNEPVRRFQGWQKLSVSVLAPGLKHSSLCPLPRIVGPVLAVKVLEHGPLPVNSMTGLLKKLLINLLDVQRLFDNATDAMKNHQSGELVSVHEDNSLAQLFSRLARR